MSVEELIKELEKLPKDSIVIMSDPDEKGWTNIDRLVDNKQGTIKIVEDNGGLFDD